MQSDKHDALVIGGGPAGLAAADVLSAGGVRVLVADAMPSLGRKFLMAGKSGLNLTKVEPRQDFLSAYGDVPRLTDIVRAFDADAVQRWAAELDQPLFTGSTGRVFPTAMKASPLLRAWLARLQAAGVSIRTRWRFTGWDGDAVLFDTVDGCRRVTPDTIILAMGGASWRRLGSDGAWADGLSSEGIALAPFRPANVGFTLDWSTHMAAYLGQPVKGTALSASDLSSRGEWIISARGIEGGGVYEVSRAVRDGHPLTLDLIPDLSVEEGAARLAKARGKASLGNRLRQALRLDPVKRALAMEWGRPLPGGADLAHRLKTLPVPVTGTRPMDEAISTAGGVAWDAVTDDLMLKKRPGTFVAGEMLDWEAPTGGYLLTACLATGHHAGRGALRRLRSE